MYHKTCVVWDKIYSLTLPSIPQAMYAANVKALTLIMLRPMDQVPHKLQIHVLQQKLNQSFFRV